MRFLTVYPKRLLSGKSAPWYFISRLTSNDPYDDLNMGDRILALWQGSSYYHFTTCDKQKGFSNVIKNVNFDDIEGVWTYVYYSYSMKQQRAVGFIKYTNEEKVRRIQFDVEHPYTQQLKFVLGGRDLNKYPAFNGVFAQIIYSVENGAFISDLNELNELSRGFQIQPQKQKSVEIINDPTNFIQGST